MPAFSVGELHDNNVTVFIMTCKMPIKPLYPVIIYKVSIALKVIVNIAENHMVNLALKAR